ncbi:hypothetical protein WJX73_010406 [Symbiochloris irregularis]|uniref:Uncharacterized protein n=1 Tax=Symbiochloris irregularis TaxID=706552 RepID=A0AAW1NT09_9CHLO
MGLPKTSQAATPVVIVLVLIAWVVQLSGLYFVHRSCHDRTHLSPWWAAATGAQLPAADSCLKVFRYQWWTVWFEFPLVLGIVASWAGWIGSGGNWLNRYRTAIIGLLATCTALQMWSANVMLNLTDTLITKSEDSTEVMRARVTFLGFATLAALNAVLIIILGDDGPSASEAGHEPLIGSDA